MQKWFSEIRIEGQSRIVLFLVRLVKQKARSATSCVSFHRFGPQKKLISMPATKDESFRWSVVRCKDRGIDAKMVQRDSYRGAESNSAVFGEVCKTEGA